MKTTLVRESLLAPLIDGNVSLVRESFLAPLIDANVERLEQDFIKSCKSNWPVNAAFASASRTRSK
ncbi:MAG: hypothetical protein JSV78_02545, partial [Phycisphaerales bacterium]